jgi:hypothetical protein
MAGDFEVETRLTLQQPGGVHRAIVVIGLQAQALRDIVGEKIFRGAFAATARRGRVQDRAGGAFEHQHRLGIGSEHGFVGKINFGAIAGFLRMQHLVDLLLRELRRQRLQLLRMFAGSGPACRGFALAARGLVNILGQTRHPLSVIALGQLIGFVGLAGATQLRKQFLLGFALGADGFFRGLGHGDIPGRRSLLPS